MTPFFVCSAAIALAQVILSRTANERDKMDKTETDKNQKNTDKSRFIYLIFSREEPIKADLLYEPSLWRREERGVKRCGRWLNEQVRRKKDLRGVKIN